VYGLQKWDLVPNINDFRNEFNNIHPHESLGQETPASLLLGLTLIDAVGDLTLRIPSPF
jgi:hypothetical protein